MKVSKKVPYVFTFICIIIGFMIALQYQSVQDPVISDSRDMIDLRVSLQNERDRTQVLLDEISKVNQLLSQYTSAVDAEERVTAIMQSELQRIKKIAGYEEMEGEGFILYLEKIEDYNSSDFDFEPIIYDDDLRMLINELNSYGAKAIAINGQRIVASTAVRNVGETILVNTMPIRPPYEIKVIGDSELLIPALRLSGINSYFKVVNHQVRFEVHSSIQLPAFARQQTIQYLEPLKEVN